MDRNHFLENIRKLQAANKKAGKRTGIGNKDKAFLYNWFPSNFNSSPKAPKNMAQKMRVAMPNKGRAPVYTNFGPTKTPKAIQAPNISYMRAPNAGPKMSQANINSLAQFRFKHPNMAHMNLAQFEILKKSGLLTPSPSPPRKPAIKARPIHIIPVVPVKMNYGITRKNTPKRRIRIDGKLPTGYKKADLLALLRKKGISVESRLTIPELISVLNKYAPKTNKPKTSEEWLLKVSQKFKPLEKRTKRELQNYANRHQIRNVKMRLLKANMIEKIEKRLETNVKAILRKYIMANEDPSKLTMRMVLDRLIRNHAWNKAKNINRKKIQEIVENNWKVLI